MRKVVEEVKKTIVCILTILMILASYSFAFANNTSISSEENMESSELYYKEINQANNEDCLNDELRNKYSDEVLEGYKELSSYLSQNELSAEISLETFSNEYMTGNYNSMNDYLDSYYDILVLPQNEKDWTDDSKWYYNTGTSLMDEPNYSSRNLLNLVKAGDIIYEGAGGSGLTGHTAIVEGIFFDSKYSRFYIRVVEAIGYIGGSIGQGDGVCRGVLDDDRFSDRIGVILRVPSASSSQKEAAIDFCISQIGKPYSLDLGHGTAQNEGSWYCSELVWAAYKNQGIDLETNSTLPGITPDEIKGSSLTTIQSVTYGGTPSISSFTINSGTSVTIKWNEVSDATKYYVYRSTSISGSYSLVTSTASTSYKDTGLTSGETYYYRIAAYKSKILNKSAPRGVKLCFGVPVITRYCPKSKTSINIQWTRVRNATGYYVYRATSSDGTYNKIATVSSASYTNTGLTDGQTYYYKVAAYNDSSTSSKTGYKAIRPTSCQKPSIYFGKSGSSTSATIKWTNVPKANYYRVYRSNSSTGSYSQIAQVSSTSYRNTGLSPNTTYYYKVKAFNTATGISSLYSSYKSITTN